MKNKTFAIHLFLGTLLSGAVCADPNLFWVCDAESGTGGSGLVVYTNGLPVPQGSDWLVELVDVDADSVLYSVTNGFPFGDGGFWASVDAAVWNGRTVKTVIYNASMRSNASLAAEFNLSTNLSWSTDPAVPAEFTYNAGVVGTADWEAPAALLYRTWIESFGVADTNVLAHSDGDIADNLTEYALGGNPVIGTDGDAIQPVAAFIEDGGFQGIEYVYNRRIDHAIRGLAYWLELTDDLVGGSWTNAGYSVEGIGVVDSEFESVTNRIPSDIKTNQFIRLKTGFSD